jgi:hypothetical protein
MLSLLVKHGAQLGAKDAKGKTAAMLARQYSHREAAAWIASR